MALQDLIAQNQKKLTQQGPNGQLVEQTPEEIQTLASKANLASPPLTAMGQGMIGANPAQQKMAGTPAQKTAALQQAQQPPQNNLAQATREQQTNTQASASTQAAKQKSQDLQNLGSVGDRVTDLINTKKQELGTQAAGTTPVQVNAADTFNGKDLSAIKPLLAQLRADPTNQQLMLQVNQALGYDVNTQLDPSQIDQLYGSAVDAIASGAGGVVDQDLTVSDLNLGYTPDQLGQLLGIPAAQASALTVAQLRDQVKLVQQQEFSKSANLTQQAQSGQLGQAEQGAAAAGAKEASATGLRATEADVNHLQNQIAAGDQVTFGGQTYSVEDLLKNGTVSGIVQQYLNSAPGSDIRQQIDSTEPQLSAFIAKNQTLLTQASQQLQQGATTFQGTQTANQNLGTIGGVKMPDALAAKLIPGYGQLQANQIDPNSVPILKYASSLTPAQQTKLSTELNAAYNTDPGIADQLNGLTPDQLTQLNIGGDGNTPWKQYTTAKQTADQAKAANTPDELVHQLFSDAPPAAQLQQFMDEDSARSVLGIPHDINSNEWKLLDANNDGKIDDSATLEKNISTLYPPPSLQSIISGSYQAYQPQQLGQESAMSTVQQSLFDKLSGAAADGKVTSDEIDAAKLNLDELQTLAKTANPDQVDISSVNDKITAIQTKATSDAISSIMKANTTYDDVIDRLQHAIATSNGAVTGNTKVGNTSINDIISTIKNWVHDHHTTLRDTKVQTNWGTSRGPRVTGQGSFIDKIMNEDTPPY